MTLMIFSYMLKQCVTYLAFDNYEKLWHHFVNRKSFYWCNANILSLFCINIWIRIFSMGAYEKECSIYEFLRQQTVVLKKHTHKLSEFFSVKVCRAICLIFALAILCCLTPFYHYFALNKIIFLIYSEASIHKYDSIYQNILIYCIIHIHTIW